MPALPIDGSLLLFYKCRIQAILDSTLDLFLGFSGFLLGWAI